MKTRIRLLLLLALISSPGVRSQTGTLDLSFGTGGIVATDFLNGADIGRNGLLLPDGRIIACGSGGGFSGFLIARFDTEGAIDSGFGSNGFVSTAWGGSNVEAIAIARQQDGKLVVAGYYAMSGTGVAAVARYDSNGTLDPAFGVNGKASQSIGLGASVSDLALLPDGKVLIAGTFRSGSTLFMGLRRYRVDGIVDSSFGINGTVTRGPGIDNSCSAITIQDDDKILAAGTTLLSTGGEISFLVFRFKPNGSPDSTFGTVGRVVTSPSMYHDVAVDVAVLDDGRVVVGGYAGSAFNTTHRYVVARYTPSGIPDSTFGGDGIALTPEIGITTGFAFLTSMIVLPSGKILLAGQGTNLGTSDDFALVRMNPDTTMDGGFGVNGMIFTNIAGSGRDIPYRLLHQTDGKIIALGVGGGGEFANGGRFTLVRYLHDELPALLETKIPVSASWNIVSVPRMAAGYDRSDLFPTATSAAFAYGASGYVNRDTLSNGSGYWLKFASDQVISLGGEAILRDTIPVQQGWNLIGSVSTAVAVTDLVSIPGAIVTSPFYGYGLGYSVSDSIRPGVGYWVKMSQSGQLVLDSHSGSDPAARISIVPTTLRTPPSR